MLKKTPEITKNGCELLFNGYHVGKERMGSLSRQEFYKTEKKVVAGRRLRNVSL